jgi:hypothetical protein
MHIYRIKKVKRSLHVVPAPSCSPRHSSNNNDLLCPTLLAELCWTTFHRKLRALPPSTTSSCSNRNVESKKYNLQTRHKRPPSMLPRGSPLEQRLLSHVCTKGTVPNQTERLSTSATPRSSSLCPSSHLFLDQAM